MNIPQISIIDASKWLIRFPPPPDITARLICFHWAGGNGYAFRPWSKLLQAAGIELISMMLPGRLARSKDPLITNIGDIASMVALNLTGPNQPKTVFFGHSYGGIIAYELAARLQLERALQVSHLIISSTNNPSVLSQKSVSCDSNTQFFHKLSDEDLLAEVLRHGGLPDGVHLDLLRHALPVIRADYKALETYIHPALPGSPSTPTENSSREEQCHGQTVTSSREKEIWRNARTWFRGPITVFGGGADVGDLTEESLRGWQEFASDPEEGFTMRLFPGGSHFYFMDKELHETVLGDVKGICLSTEPLFCQQEVNS